MDRHRVAAVSPRETDVSPRPNVCTGLDGASWLSPRYGLCSARRNTASKHGQVSPDANKRSGNKQKLDLSIKGYGDRWRGLRQPKRKTRMYSFSSTLLPCSIYTSFLFTSWTTWIEYTKEAISIESVRTTHKIQKMSWNEFYRRWQLNETDLATSDLENVKCPLWSFGSHINSILDGQVHKPVDKKLTKRCYSASSIGWDFHKLRKWIKGNWLLWASSLNSIRFSTLGTSYGFLKSYL